MAGTDLESPLVLLGCEVLFRGRLKVPVRDAYVKRVHRVVELREVVARPHGVARVDGKLGLLVVEQAGELRRLSFTQIGEDEPQVFLYWVAVDLDPVAERLGLGRLLSAL